MDPLKVFFKKLGASRAALTKTVNKINELDPAAEENILQVESFKSTLINQSERLEGLNEEIDEKCNEDKLEEEFEKVEDYRTSFSMALGICDNIITRLKSCTTSSNSHNLRLPKLSLPTFSGEILEFQEFMEAFTLVIDKTPIDNYEKLQYLKSCLKGDAVNILSGLPLTSANYSVALNLLKNRYGSTKRILQMHIRSLLSLQTPNIKSAASLRSFVDSVNKHVRGLETLNIRQDNYDIILCEILLSRMPSEIKHQWVKLKDDQLTLNELLQLVDNEARHRDLLIAKNNEANFSKRETSHNSKPILNRSFALKSINCAYCKQGDHAIYRCPKFVDNSHRQRKDIVRDLNLCINCF